MLQDTCWLSIPNADKSMSLGLNRQEFIDYLYMLTIDSDDGEMNAIVLAPGARFIRVVRNVSDLKSVLGDYRPDWDPEPSNTLRPKPKI